MNESIWIVKWRPKVFRDVILSSEMTKYFQTCIETKNLPHILLYGRAGIGKTTIGNVIANELKSDFLYINGSKEKTIDILRDKIDRFASTYSDNDMWGDNEKQSPKIVFIDECEKITFQDALKVVMEEMEANCRFILATNNISKIIDPLKDDERCHTFNLVPSEQKERSEIALKYLYRMRYILEQEKVEYDEAVLKTIVKKCFPSMRKIISTCNKTYLTNGKIGSDIIFDDLVNKNLIDLLNSKDILGIRKLVANIDPVEFMREIYETFDKYIQPEQYFDFASIYGEFAWRNSLHDDKESNVFTFLIMLINKKIKLQIKE